MRALDAFLAIAGSISLRIALPSSPDTLCKSLRHLNRNEHPWPATANPLPIRCCLPGILLAATGVGAGDLLTASMAGSEVGLAILWAVLAGAILKWTLSEGIARWQLATGTTLIEGWARQLGSWIQWIFLVYLVLFTFVVGGALVTACGVAGAGLLPLGDAESSKIIWGIIHSLVGLGLVWLGSFRLFELVMSVCIGIIFVTVLLTAVLIQPDWAGVAWGFVPSLPEGGDGLESWQLWAASEGRSRCSPTATGFGKKAAGDCKTFAPAASICFSAKRPRHCSAWPL